MKTGVIVLYKNLFSFLCQAEQVLIFLNAKFQPVGSYMRVFTVLHAAQY